MHIQRMLLGFYGSFNKYVKPGRNKNGSRSGIVLDLTICTFDSAAILFFCL